MKSPESDGGRTPKSDGSGPPPSLEEGGYIIVATILAAPPRGLATFGGAGAPPIRGWHVWAGL
ncbi:hypothetical protein Syun_027845 [Stephania yunnanensis]|uniref:Uncharacterized protein n=1 Tax=Stephania yunnanensis TaxID=152371 RepID=A0AAP0EQ76_9MAGN